MLPTKLKHWVVLRSPFKHKKSQEHFERRTHRRFITIEGNHRDVSRFIRFASDFTGERCGLHYRTQFIEPLESFYTLNLPVEHPLRRAAANAVAASADARR